MTDVVYRLLAQAERTPSGVAVAGSQPTTYAEFVARAAAFADRIGAVANPRVLLALEKGLDAYAAMFGTLMAGGTYAPVSVSSPQARLAHIVQVFEPDFIVAEPALGRLLGPKKRVVDPLEVPLASKVEMRSPADLAYVIFTSGSTGAPKGVAIPRTALAHYIDWAGPAMKIGPGDRMSQHPNVGFDLSVLDIYGSLCFGAALHPFVGTSARLLPARKVRDDAITIWNSVPSVLAAMETAGELDATHLASVRLFTFCGEVLRPQHVAKLFAARPDAIVLNTYGPTEATVAMTCRPLSVDNYTQLCMPSAPLGMPIGDMRLDLVGGPDDGPEEGEIVISGPQLAAGYYRDEALTKVKFRNLARGHQAQRHQTTRAFYTGDYAARIDGELYFLGRRDDMVKVRGHRVHLSEVREALQKLGWTESFVFEKDGTILAIVEDRSDIRFDEACILTDLAELLDSYFMPASVRRTDKFPRTGNDKLDGAALKAEFDAGAAHGQGGAVK